MKARSKPHRCKAVQPSYGPPLAPQLMDPTPTGRHEDHHGHPGVWRLEGRCGDCGNCDTVSMRRLKAAQKRGGLPVFCTGHKDGRPSNRRCGFALSWVWIFYPPGKV